MEVTGPLGSSQTMPGRQIALNLETLSTQIFAAYQLF